MKSTDPFENGFGRERRIPDMDHQKIPQQADAVVIGGGIMGLAASFYMAKAGIKSVVIEKHRVASQQSGRNWGFVRCQYRDPAEMSLAIESLKLWPILDEALGYSVGWRRTGCLFAAAHDEESAAFERWLTEVQGSGVSSRLLSPREVSAVLPSLKASSFGALFTAEDGQAEPMTATQAFARASEDAGVEVIEHCGAYGIEVEAGRVAGVLTECGMIRAPIVVCAAGATSHHLLQAVGLRLPQKVVRNTVSLTEPLPPLSVPCFCGFGIGLRQRKDNSCILAAESTSDIDLTLDSFRYLKFFMPALMANRKTFEFDLGKPLVDDIHSRLVWSRRERVVEPRAPSIRPNRKRIRAVSERLGQLFDGAKDVVVSKSWAGNIDVLPDAIPVIDGDTGIPGLIVATGFSGHGFGLGPGVGRIVGSIAAGSVPTINTDAFRLNRFSQGTFGSPYAPL